MNRRKLLKSLGSVGVAYVAQTVFRQLPFMAVAQAPRTEADVLVVVFQRGGMDGLTAVAPYGEGANYYDRRPNLAVPEPGKDGGALDLDGFFGLHPALLPLKELYDEQVVSVIHATGSPDPTRSHFDAMAYMEKGLPGDRKTASGWLNRHLQTVPWENDSPFRAVGMGTMVQAALRGPVSALAMKSIIDFHLQGQEDQLGIVQRNLAQLYNVPEAETMLELNARETLSTMNFLKRVAQTEYQPAKGASYPETEFGQGLKNVAQLIKADIGLEVACVDIGGWDTHREQGGRIGGLLQELSAGLMAFYTDMGKTMRQVTVVTMSEFGRRVLENASNGTDHGHGNCMFMLGGGAKPGVFARWPGLGEDALDRGDLAITTDYRDVLSELVSKRLANPRLAEVFPGYTASPLDLLKARA